MTSYTRKTRDLYRIYTNYGYGWEKEITADTMKDAQYQKREYLLAGRTLLESNAGARCYNI